MQLHPNNSSFGKEVNILRETSLIGLGDWEDLRGQVDKFINEMAIGDVVLIKRGKLAIALVEVVGEAAYLANPNGDLDWFENRRKIKILDIFENGRYDFPQPRGTLARAIGRETPTYKYINDWYNRVAKNSIIKNVATNKMPHLFGMFIEDHKMFSNFKISLTDKEGMPLPVVVIAGVNGSGKTTLLEYINGFVTEPKFSGGDYVEFQKEESQNFNETTRKIYKSSKLNDGVIGIKDIKNSIRYFPIDVDATKDTEQLIAEHTNKLIKNNDLRPSEATQKIGEGMDKVFSALDISIHFNGTDEKNNVFFINSQGKIFSINELSSGEKTLLSKVFRLYIGDYSGKIILIDEPEISLHPSWQNKIIKIYEEFCKDYNSQIILATHSPLIIGSAKNEYVKILSRRNDKIEVIDGLKSYGREANWVLTEVMGVNSVRLDDIAKKITECKKLLDEEKYEECERSLDLLESEIGGGDPEVEQLRNILFFEKD